MKPLDSYPSDTPEAHTKLQYDHSQIQNTSPNTASNKPNMEEIIPPGQNFAKDSNQISSDGRSIQPTHFYASEAFTDFNGIVT